MLLPFVFLVLMVGLSVTEVLTRMVRQEGIILSGEKGLIIAMLRGCAGILLGLVLLWNYLVNSDPAFLLFGTISVMGGILWLIWPPYDLLIGSEKRAAQQRIIVFLAAVPCYVALSTATNRSLGDSADVFVQLTLIVLVIPWAVWRLLAFRGG